MNVLVNAVLSMGGVGLTFGVLLALADEKLKVEINPLEESVLEALPGVNCGACGYPGCSGYAHQVSLGNLSPDKCVVGGQDLADKLGELLGVKVEQKEKNIAFVKCQGDKSRAAEIFKYDGFPDCQTAVLVSCGSKACIFGCLGFGTCARVCPFGAIKMNPDTNLPEIDGKLCTSCGICVAECPKKIMALVPEKNKVEIRCSSFEKGIEVKKKCTIGCIACQICVKKCPENAITMEDNLAKIDYNKCTNCLQCVPVCPTKAIFTQESI